ncbi:MAG: hypothetical protein AB1726_11995, partial [Planctomycetota bacterium]
TAAPPLAAPPVPAAPAAPADPASAPVPAPPPEDGVLGTVAGSPLSAADLLAEWYQVAPREVWLVVDKLVAVRLARAEGARLGIAVAAAEVEARAADEERKLAADVARERPGTTVERFVMEELGQDPARYAGALRCAAADQLLIERVVRTWVLSHENLGLRLVVVPAGDIETIQGMLAGGADFAEVARVHSIDDTAEEGGLVPYLVRQEGSPLTLLAFQTAAGEIGGPLRAGEHELLFRVEAVRAPLAEDWEILRGPVLESLEAHPVADAEFVHWKLAMERQYPFDLRPLRALLGASAAGQPR